MKKLYIFILLLLPVFATGKQNLYFATQPSLTPDGKEIFFCYDGGIWRVPVDGGTAARITAMKGYQIKPVVSPDGKWLAFTSNEQGNNNVYIVPVNGGEIKQLTFHDGSDVVSSWSKDSKYIYFESGRYNGRTTYKVSIDGGTPERLFDGYFNTIASLVENPVNGTYYFVSSNEGYGSANRKGYKGDNNPEIESWDPVSEKYENISNYNGKDLWPTVDKKGNLYWATDNQTSEYNLAKLEDGKVKLLTNFNDASIQEPQVSYNGNKIVFVKDYMIHVYDVVSQSVATPEINIFYADSPDVMLTHNTDGNITTMDISPDGKKFAFVSRGYLFVSDSKGLFVKKMDTDPKERVLDVKWSIDNKNIYYTRTRGGWYNLYKIAADGSAAEREIYTPDAMVKGLTFNRDRSKLAFITGTNRLDILTTATDKVEKIAENEFWAHSSSDIVFSPDNKYIAYEAMNLFEVDIFIYEIATKKAFNFTNSATSESSPAWSKDGKYMYITANRYASSFPRGGRGNLYKIKLDFTERPLLTDKYSELFKSDPVAGTSESGKSSKDTGRSSAKASDKSSKKGSAASAGSGSANASTDTPKTDISFNMENIQRRWEAVIDRGSQSWVQTFVSGGKEYIVYSSNHEGNYGIYVQEINDFERKDAKKIPELSFSSGLISNGKDIYAIQRGAIYSVDLAGAKAKKVDVKYSFAKNTRYEFEQMFHEVWAQLAQNFYDPDFHGVNWTAKHEYYAQFLPYIRSRKDLSVMTNDMLGELNSSHLGFSSRGDEEKTATSIRTVTTGILFDNSSPYKVAEILKNSPAYKKDGKVQIGDELVAVNGVTVDVSKNREAYFAQPNTISEITLKFRRGSSTYEETFRTANSYNISNILYTKWEDECRERVDKATGGRVAYHHMRDMGAGALNSFLIDMHTDAVHKDALILDLRYNNGGNVHDEVLEYLSRRSHFTWKYRDMQSNTHPNVVPGDKPIVVLINERSLSDAEVTSNGIQTLGIAKLVGTETYRWIIFTSGTSMVDGSSCRLPAWGCHNLKGEDMEFAGVAPDIYIRNTFEDRLYGRDPQLDKAIEEILKNL